MSPDELAQKLLEMNDVNCVAKMLCSAIPEAVKEQYFSQELKRFIASINMTDK